MSFAEEFKEVERRALVENTAQDVFNILKDLESQASLHASRWIWELLQNARDAAHMSSPLCIRVSFTPTEVTFQHNGLAFTKDQVAHLIHHGSTKAHEEELVGRFGTGFLSSHIISKKPHVSGYLDDGQCFAFTLDRTGATPKELTTSMERSSQEFVQSVSSEPVALDHSTRFAYPLTSDVEAIAQQGVESLKAYAPYVLAFNEEISSIEILQGKEQRIYQRQSDVLPRESIQLILVEEYSASSECLASYKIACVAKGDVAVAVLAKRVGGSHEIQFGADVPKLFMAFPLFGTEGMGFPGVLNSRQFRPKKDRDGLYLGKEQTEYNLANKKLVEQACPHFLTLLEQCANSKWKGIERLCHVNKSEPIRGIDEAWFQSLIKGSIVEPLRELSLLSTCGTQLIAPCHSQIPLGSLTVPSDELWQLLYDLSDSEEALVERATAASWEENVREWATIIGTSPDAMQEGITIEKCAHVLAEFESLDRLKQSLRSGCNPVDWCNKLFSLLLQAGQAALFDSLALLPDQTGHFRKRKELSLDMGIDESLKDIGELLELPIRNRLLHKDASSISISRLLQEKKQIEILNEVSGQLRLQAKIEKQGSGFRSGNIRLFTWIVKNAAFDNLEAFPALTQEAHGEGEPANTITLTGNIDIDATPLSPPELWPEGAGEFAELFPSRHILSSAYYSECPDEQYWVSVEIQGFVRLSPIYQTTEDIQDFLPDSTLTDDTSHKSKNSVATTQIAFLREKNVGLMDSARKSKSKCLALLRFLATYLIYSDPSWSEHPEADCECGKTHKYWRAGWIIPLKKNKWVYLDKNRSELISVDSLARLLKHESEVVNLLSEGQGPAFLSDLGVNAGDFLMRVVTPDEQSHVMLSKSFIQIVQAIGGDIQQATDLALEIASYPDTVRELQERAAVRRKVKRNQDIGKTVEEVIEMALGTERGLKVTRVPIGSDYSVEPENDFLDESGQEVLLEVGTPHVRFLIEIKATTGNFVRMTEMQGKKAEAFPESYALCVVALSGQDDEISVTTVREKSMFIFDIGTRVKPLVEALESIEQSKSRALTTTGEIELEMQDQIVKFKVGREVWEAGIEFDDAILLFGGTKATYNVPSDTVPTEQTTGILSSVKGDGGQGDLIGEKSEPALKVLTRAESSSDSKE